MKLKDAVKKAKAEKKVISERASKKWTRTKIQDLILTNDIFVERSLCVLLARQTTDEQRYEQTGHNNGMGFTPVDAKFLTSCAKQVVASRNYPVGKRLSHKQMHWVRKKIFKYAKQLADYSNNKNMIMAEEAVGVTPTGKDFEKGGTFSKVDHGHKKE